MARKRKQQQAASPTRPEPDAAINPPVLASARIVTAHDHQQLGSLRHVVSSISSFLDYSKSWTLESASDAGLEFLLDRLRARQWSEVGDTFLEARFLRGIRHAAIKGDLQVLKWWWTKYLPTSRRWEDMKEIVVRIAAFHGHLSMIEWILKDEKTLHTVANMNSVDEDQWLICQHPEIVYWIHDRSRRAKLFVILDEAIKQGDMAFLKWVHSNRARHRHEFSNAAINIAGEVGHLEVLQFLREHEDDGFSDRLRHNAAKAGYLKLLKWLETTYSECELWMGRYKSLDSEAARNGHLDSVKWMVEECKVFLIEDAECLNWHGKAMNAAIEAGNWYVLRYLFDHRPFEFTTRGLNLAIIRGDLEMTKWLHANRFQCLDDPMEDAAEHGYLAILRWLYETLPDLGICVSVMDFAAENNHLHIVKWLHENRSTGCSDTAMILAAANGVLDMVQWLHTNRQEFGAAESKNVVSSDCPTTVRAVPVSAVDFAAAKGYLDIVKFLLGHQDVHCTTTTMNVATSSGHLDIVKWLHENRAGGCTVNAMGFAASNGFLNVVRWLHENRNEGCTVEAVDAAASRGFYMSSAGCLKIARRNSQIPGSTRLL